MTFTIPASRRATADRFEFTIGEGKAAKTYSLPHLKYAPVRAVEHFEFGRNLSGLIACADDEPTREAIRDMDSEQMHALMDAWRDASKVAPGESPASD